MENTNVPTIKETEDLSRFLNGEIYWYSNKLIYILRFEEGYDYTQDTIDDIELIRETWADCEISDNYNEHDKYGFEINFK